MPYAVRHCARTLRWQMGTTMIETNPATPTDSEAARRTGLVLDAARGLERPPLLLQSGHWTIGSADDAEVRVELPGVADRHATIEVDGQDVFVTAHDAEHTQLNGRAVEIESLHAGDRLTVGPVEFELREPTSDELLSLVPEPSIAPPGQDVPSGDGHDADWQAHLDGRMKHIEHLVNETISRLAPATHEGPSLSAATALGGDETESALRSRQADLEVREQVWLQGVESLRERRAELDARETELDDRTQAWEAAVRRSRKRDAEVRLRQRELVELGETLTARREELERAEERLAAQRATLDRERSEFERERMDAAETDAERRRELDRVQEQLSHVEAEQQARGLALDRHEEELTVARREIDGRLDAVAERERELERRARELDDFRRTLEERSSELPPAGPAACADESDRQHETSDVPSEEAAFSDEVFSSTEMLVVPWQPVGSRHTDDLVENPPSSEDGWSANTAEPPAPREATAEFTQAGAEQIGDSQQGERGPEVRPNDADREAPIPVDEVETGHECLDSDQETLDETEPPPSAPEEEAADEMSQSPEPAPHASPGGDAVDVAREKLEFKAQLLLAAAVGTIVLLSSSQLGLPDLSSFGKFTAVGCAVMFVETLRSAIGLQRAGAHARSRPRHTESVADGEDGPARLGEEASTEPAHAASTNLSPKK